MPKATWNGAVLAECDKTEVVDGNHYFPPEAVRRQFLQESGKLSQCGWKGTASYYDVVVDGHTNKDAAWYYPNPLPGAVRIAGHVAFWKGVEVVP